MMSPKQNICILVAILVLALGARVFLLAHIAPNDFYASPWYQGEGGDAAEYSAIAVSLAHGKRFALNGKATSIRPPLYPLMLAAVYKVFGDQNLTAVRIAQVLMAFCALMVFWAFAYRMFQNSLAAHLATLTLGLYPRFAVYNMAILTETLFFLLMLLVLFFAIKFRQTQRTTHAAMTLCFLALAALTRPTALYFAPVLFWWMLFYSRSPVRQTWRMLFPGTMLFLALCGFWVFRNWRQFDAFTFSSKSGGTIAESWDRTVLEPLGISDRDILAPYKGLGEEAFARAGYALFFSEIRNHPLLIAKIAFLKFLYWFNPSVKSSVAWLRTSHTIFMSALYAFGVWGVYRYTRAFGWTVPLLWILLFLEFTAMHVLTVPYHRYRFPVMDPYLMLFGSYAVVEFWNKWILDKVATLRRAK